MENKQLRVKQIFFSRQFGIFIIIGIINTFNGILFPTLLSSLLQINLAYILSYIPSLGIAYLLNCKYTFSIKPELQSLVRFYLSYIPNFIIQNMIFALFINVLHLHKFIGIILASAIGVPITFLLLRFYAFKTKVTDYSNKKSQTEE